MFAQRDLVLLYILHARLAWAALFLVSHFWRPNPPFPLVMEICFQLSRWIFFFSCTAPDKIPLNLVDGFGSLVRKFNERHNMGGNGGKGRVCDDESSSHR